MSNWQQAMPSPAAYRIDRVLYDIHHDPERLSAYLDDPDAYLEGSGMPAEHREAVRDNDIGAMYLAGTNPYLLRAHCLGVGVPEDTFLLSLRAVAGEEVAGG